MRNNGTRWWTGLGLRTSAASLLVLVAVVGLAHTLTARSTEARMQAELDAAAQSILMRWTLGLVEPVWNLDTDQARRLVDVEFLYSGVEAASVVDATGATLLALQRSGDGTVDLLGTPTAAFRRVEAVLQRDGEEIGTATLWLNDAPVRSGVAAATADNLQRLAGVGTTLVLILNLVLRRWVARPLATMSQVVAQLAALKPGETLDAVEARKREVVGRYGRDGSEIGVLCRALDRFVGVYTELKATTDAAQRAGLGLECASANLLLPGRRWSSGARQCGLSRLCLNTGGCRREAGAS